MDEERTFLGLDLSSQQLKAAIVNDNLQILQEAAVIFDTDLPEFRTTGGAIIDKRDNRIITAPTIMWVKALDILLDRLTLTGADFGRIAAISGTAQQHGSVYWGKNCREVLKNLNSSSFLHQELSGCFSLNYSPIWMDASTSVQCRQLEEVVGGPEKLAEITGSKAYERFTASQIAKIFQTKPEAYHKTERISLVSSFLCSLFLGDIAPIDMSDGSGMNLMDIKTKKWNEKLLNACGPNLREKLGEPVPSNHVVGNISNYFVERYSFAESCKIVACTGDNPASLIAMGLKNNQLAVSLGTSDCIFLWLNKSKVVLDGHVLINPVNPEEYMALITFKNGSLTRERIRDKCCEGSWDLFNQLLESTPRGNFGNLGLYYDVQEILPFLQGDYRFNKSSAVKKFTSLEVEVRALIEGQFLAKRAYTEDFGFKVTPETRIIATGGASANKAILQVLSDVFNCPVYVQEAANSAMLGSAYQAKHGLMAGQKTYSEIIECLPEPTLVCEPFKDAAEVYDPMVIRYKEIVKTLLR